MSKEIMMVVDAVSNEKGVDKEVIFEALEAALASATRKKHGEEWDVRVSINRKTGDYDTFRRWKVFADDSKELEVPDRELRLEDALDVDKTAVAGGHVEEPMESVSFGRIAAQQAKQVIVTASASSSAASSSVSIVMASMSIWVAMPRVSCLART
jgi:N utilization substance protein A